MIETQVRLKKALNNVIRVKSNFYIHDAHDHITSYSNKLVTIVMLSNHSPMCNGRVLAA